MPMAYPGRRRASLELAHSEWRLAARGAMRVATDIGCLCRATRAQWNEICY